MQQWSSSERPLLLWDLTMIQYYEKYFSQWLERLRAVRNLPKDTILPFKTSETKELLGELTTLPNETDPVNWLMENHTNLISHVLFWKILSTAKTIFLTMQLDFDSPYSDVGQKLQLTINKKNLQKLTESPWEISDKSLQRIHRLLLDKVQIDAPDTDDIYLLLFIEMIRLSEDDNPLTWLKTNYLEVAALFTIKFLLSESIPTSWTHWDLLPHFKNLFANISTNDFSFKLTNLNYGDAGFTIEGAIDVANKLKKKHGRNVLVKWESAVRLNDDLGNSYLNCSQKYEGGTTKSRDGVSNYLRLYCYPPISPDANLLHVTFISPTIFVQELRGKHLITASTYHLENFMLTINVK